MIQLGLLALTAAAIFLVNAKSPSLRRWGPVCGLASQPFWFVALESGQWGMFVLNFIVLASWINGVRNTWP